MTTLTPDRHGEAAFQSVIEAQLLAHGYTSLPSGYDRARALFPDVVTGFIKATQLFFDQLAEVAANSDALQQAAQVNSADKFVLLFKRLLESLFIERIDQNESMFARYMNDPEFQRLVAESLGADVYQRLTGKELATLKYTK